jgi:TonB family protein
VLLPPRVADLPAAAQRAIVCHELLHVARRDWAWTLIDEAIQTACWWHPAIWWALAQVHLQREEVIDARVVAITAARQPYMRALMLFADATPAAAAAAAIPFIRRRHLAARLRQLAQEVPMSRMRSICVSTALVIIIASASWAGVAALPLQETQTTKADQPIRLKGENKDKCKVLNEVKAEYPKEALLAHIQGEVILDVTIAKDGTVADAKVVKGIPELNKAATDAARKWKFEPVVIDGKNVEALVTMTIRFSLKKGSDEPPNAADKL